LTSILLCEPLIELVNAGCRSIVNTYPLIDGSNRSEVSAGMPEESTKQPELTGKSVKRT